MNLPVEVCNVTQRIATAFRQAGKPLIIDGSSGAVARREAEGYFNVFYKLQSNGAAENYFVRDVRDIALFVNVLVEAAVQVSSSEDVIDSEKRFCFRDCFVYRTNCFDASNAAKPWWCRLCIDFDTPAGSEKTRQPERRLDFDSVSELVEAVAPFIEGCDLCEQSFVAYGSNSFADKSVSLHIVFFNCVLAKDAGGKMTKQLSERIAELPICRALYVQPDFSIYTSGLKPLGMDKQVNKVWRGDSQYMIGVRFASDDPDFNNNVDAHSWRKMFEKSCIIVPPDDRNLPSYKIVRWKSDLPPASRRLRRTTTTLLTAATTDASAVAGLAQNSRGSAVDFEQRVRGDVRLSAFAQCVFRNGSKPNILVPIAITWCPYKNAEHDKVQVGFFCDERTKVVSVRCFSSECQAHPSYPLRILPPEVGGEQLEDEALRLFADYCYLLLGRPVGKLVVCRLPTAYEQDFVLMTPGDFEKANKHKQTVTYDANGKPKTIYYTNTWTNSRRVTRALAGYTTRPDDTRLIIPVGDSFAINQWRGFPPHVELASEFEPETAHVRCALFLQHLRENVCGGNDELEAFVLNWLAFLVQKLTRKPGVALWLKGKGGQGKNEFYLYLVAMLGPWHSYKTSDPSAISGSFNSHFARARLLLVEEQKGSMDGKVQSAYNDFITCDKWEVKEKFVPNREEDNFTCVMGFANEEFSGKRQKTGERRYQTTEVLYRLPQSKFEFFPAMQRERDNGGAGALLAVLRQRDIEGWFPESHIIQTEAGWMDQLHSLPKLRQWWFYVLRRGCLFEGGYVDPTTLETIDGDVFGKVVPKYLFAQAATRDNGGEAVTDTQVWIYIKQGFDVNGRHIQGQPWHEPQRGKTINVPTLEVCRKAFEEKHGYPDFIWTAKETF